MSDPDRQESFEVYPYAEPEPQPLPPTAAPLPASSLPITMGSGPVVFSPSRGVGRRGIILGAIGAGVAGMFGLAAWQAPAELEQFPPDGEWTEGPVPGEEEPVDDLVPVLLQTVEGDIGVGVPGSWEVLREGDLLHLRHGAGAELLARLPDPPSRSGEPQLRLEAEYTRARFESEFVPDGEPAAELVDEPPYELNILRSKGEISGLPGSEEVSYLVDPDRERGLVVAVLMPDEAEPEAAVDARAIVDQVLEGFRVL